MNPYDPAVLHMIGRDLDEVKARLVEELDAFEAHLQSRANDWNVTQPGREWSPAQEAEHVLLVNKGVTKVIGLLLSDHPLPEQSKVRGELRDGKRQSPKPFLPDEGLDTDWQEAWQEHRNTLQAVAERVYPTERTFWHPYLGDLNAFDWLRMITGHMYSHRLLLQESSS